MHIRSVLFDLDGTLVDSRADIAAALDEALARHGHAPVGADRISSFVGDGARMLVERALAVYGVGPDAAGDVLASYLDAYRACHLNRTVLYPGVEETLVRLEEAGVCCSVVTNKPHEFSVSLLEHCGVASRFRVVIGGDSLPERKPHPAPLLAAIEACGATPADAAMVGDGDADILAGIAAGVLTVGVTYGFRSAAELENAGAKLLIGAMPELPAVLGLASANG